MEFSIQGESARDIVAGIEAALKQERVRPGDPLPTIRALAKQLGVSSGTTAAAYRVLQARGLISSDGRRGTRVTAPFQNPPRVVASIPEGVRNLALGNPSPEFLPSLGPFLGRLNPPIRLYGEERNLHELLDAAAGLFKTDGIPNGPVAVVNGALDGLERILQASLRPGDRVAIEDPEYTPVYQLVNALGSIPDAIQLDDSGPRPQALERVLGTESRALILTPRAQNPTGAAMDRTRAEEIQEVIDTKPELLVVEIDHAGPVSGAPRVTLTRGRKNWAVIHSVSKYLSPDLRVALVTGDSGTIGQLEARQQLGSGWVSHITQSLVVTLWSDPKTQALLSDAAAAYSERRESLIRALSQRGIEAHGRSGLNVWLPVDNESSVVQALLDSGWAVMPGERFRIRSRQGVRISIATLEPAEVDGLAEDIAKSLEPSAQTRSG